MVFKLIFHPQADREFSEAYQWYEERLPGLGLRFMESIGDRLNQIVTNPLLNPKKMESYREAKVESFPYLIVYKVYEKTKIIFISSIYHTSRNPRKKYRK